MPGIKGEDEPMMEKNKMGMAIFLASDVPFFAVLILGYVYYYRQYAEGPNPATVLEPITAFIFTIFLLSSSVTLWLAEKSIARQNHSGTRLWLLVTVVLGAIFLFGQAREYIHLLNEGVTPSGSLFGTTFYTLTGFHGFHVFSGLVALAILAGLAIAGWFKGPHSVAVETVGWYWHFVDVVWIVIFGIIYVPALL
jgi:heme/copper-type cytochrome/quinol oxidase subunit 3